MNAILSNTEERYFAAVKGGNREEVTKLVRENPELLNATEEGIGPVITAKYYGKLDMVGTLVDLGAPLDPFAAAAIGREDIVNAAIHEDPEITRRFSPDGWTLLHLAAFFGHISLIKPLLDAGSDVHARSRNSQGNTPLHAALPANNQTIVKLLLGAGADVNARQVGGGFTPLHEAALIGDVSLAKMLLEHWADIGARAEGGQTAVDLAQEKGSQEMVRLLEQQRQSN